MRLNLFEIVIVRDIIDIPTVRTETVNDVFIISLYSFNALSEAKMREAMVEYGASSAKKLILDLRGNPGGYLQSAVTIAGHFLPAGKIVVRENFGDTLNEQVYRSTGRNLYSLTPDTFVVLTNGGVCISFRNFSRCAERARSCDCDGRDYFR